jgi:RHS repeat-associated protein
MQLTVGGTLTVNGQILAVGLNGAYGCDSSAETSGGGAGGSIWITASNLTGSGAIAANGGYAPGASHTGGGGGGGRIAIYYTTNSFAGGLSAVGNYGSQYGGAGTIYTKAASQTWGQLTLDNGGNVGAATVLPGNETFDNLLVQGQAQLVVPTNEVLTVASPVLTLGTNFQMSILGQVLCAGQPGGTFTQVQVANGGTLTLGPGAQLACADLQVTSGGTLVLNATNALTASQVEVLTNGSLTVTTNGQLSSQSASVQNGGTFSILGALTISNTFMISGLVNVSPNASAICSAVIITNNGSLLLSANSQAQVGTLEIDSGGTMLLNSLLSVSNMAVHAGGLVEPSAGILGFNLSVSRNLTIDSGGAISADGLGNSSGGGVGAGAGVNVGQSSGGGGGGGYGGSGGNSTGAGGVSYGSLFQPQDLGSGGGQARWFGGISYYIEYGGSGGGALQIAVGGNLLLNGIISANGNDGQTQSTFFGSWSGGGGSGGSLWLQATNFSGTGTLSANGGNAGGMTLGGGGGGGRIAYYAQNNSFSGSITDVGGVGGQHGNPGSIYSSPINHQLVLSQQMYGRIDTPNLVDQWQFSAVSGQQIRLQQVNLSTPGLVFDLNGPNGWSGFTGITGQSALLTLTNSGDYVLTVRAVGTGYHGAYTFDLQETAETNLVPNTPFTGNFTGSGQAQLFVVNLTNGSPMLITLGNMGVGNVTELYVSFGSPPTRGSYNYHSVVANSSSQQILIPEAVSGTYYVLVYGNQISTPGGYTLTATTSDLFVTSVFPASVANGADATLTLSGAGFVGITTVQLLGSGGTAYSPRNVTVNTYNQLTATFASNTVPVGLYSVLVTKASGSSAELTNVFQFTPGGRANLVTHLVVPGVVGRHEPATIYIEYANTGNAAMPAPLLLLTCSQTPIMAITWLLPPIAAEEAFWTLVLPPAWNTNVQILASGQIPGMLQPGESNVVAISYGGLLQPWQPVNSVQFNLGVLGVTNQTPVNWSSYQSSMQPPNLAADAWAAIYQNFTSGMGPTWGSYNQSLDDASSYLGQIGLNVTDIGQLVKFEVHRADAVNVVRYLAGGLDAYVPTPGVALSFQRVFAQNISGRYKLGALGRGWSHNWDMTISNAPDGSSVTIFGPGTSIRTFLLSTLGGYYNSPGDYGQLTSLGGGVFTLQEQSGMLEAFRSDGKLNYVQDPNGNQIVCGYGGNQLTSLTHSSGQSLTIAYNGSGTIASITDSQGRQTTLGYDASGQHLTSATYFDGSTVAYNYTDPATAAANPTLAHALTQITSPTTNHEYIAYDTQGRLANLSLDGGAQSLSFSYDSEGTVFVTDANAHTTIFYLNNNGLLAKVQNPLANSVFFNYDANFNLTTFTDPTGRSYNYANDGSDNLIQYSDALGNTANFTYQSPFNSLASLVDADANLTTYGNDTKGNLRSINYANGSAEKWGYDTVGDPITWTNRRGQAIVFQFNTKGQPLSKIYPDGRTITCGYNSHALLTNLADSVQGVTRIVYDARDNVTNIVYPDGRGFSFNYDSAGRRTSRISFDGYALNYGYDAAGRLATLTDGSNNQLVQYAYDANGRLSRENKGNGTVTTYSYNSAGQLMALTNAAPGGAVQSFFNYSYDAKGNRLAMTNAAGVTAYSYDDLNQLTGVSYPSGRHVTYAYDAMGNRTVVNDTGTNLTYTANSQNQYTNVGGTIYGYDADGNMSSQTTTAGTTTYQYNAENRLVSVTTPTNGTWQYIYDALGNRSATVYGGVTNYFLLDPFGLVDVAAEYNSNGNLVARYDHGLGLVAKVDNGGNASFYSFDALGNTRQMTGIGSIVLNAYDYDVFGAVTSASESISNLFRFVGRSGVADEPSGVHFMRARFYNAPVGRFASTDPLNLNGGDLNLYRYAQNNPTMLTDSTGTSDVEEWWWVWDWTSKQTWLYKLGDLGRFSINGTYRSLGLSMKLPYVSSLGRFSFPLLIGQLIGTTTGVSIGNGLYDLFHPQDYGNWVDQFGNPLFPPTTSTTSGGSGIVGVHDPNELIGPTGYAGQNFVVDGNLFAYQILVANSTNATAPAQIVNVTDPLSNNLDWTTFQLTEIAFGTHFISIPPNVQYFQTNVPVSYNGFNFQLQIQAGINLGNGQVFANFNSINPTNNLPPPAGIGFLPPDTTNQIGEGHISYVIRPKPNLSTGLQISNIAFIQFDQNPALATDLIDDNNPSLGVDTNKMAIVTIDNTPPVSAVNPLPIFEPPTFAVSWSGTDVGSGIVGYDIYVSMNTNAYTLWQSDIPTNTAMFTGQNGQTYRFYSAAHDGAGNIEAPHVTPDAVTTVASVIITSCNQGTNGVINLTFTSLPGTTNIVEGSTNLQNWLPVGYVINTNQSLQFADNDSLKYPMRFYRIRIATNPVPPVITGQPQNATNGMGTVAQFTAVVPGPSPLGYQWQFKGNNLTDNGRISGSQSATLTISNLSSADAGNYTLVITNIMGGTNTTAASLTVVPPPTIISLTPCQTTLEGTNAVFMVTASSVTPAYYQWQFNGTNIAKATNSILTITGLQFTNAGSYSIIVSNLAGTVSSNTCLNVVTFIASQGSPAFYQSPGSLVVSCQVGYALDRIMYFLVWEPTLPPGWTITNASGNGNPQISGSEIIFDGPFPNPLNFTYTANIPAGQSGMQQIFGDGLYFLSGMTNTATAPAVPNPLLANYGTLLSLLVQNGQPQLTLQGDLGRIYRIQSSTNLRTWTDFLTMVPSSGMTHTNLPITNSLMFYRAVAP